MSALVDRRVVEIGGWRVSDSNNALGSGMGGLGLDGIGNATVRHDPVFGCTDRRSYGVPTSNTLLGRHRRVRGTKGTGVSMAEEDRVKLPEEGALEGLREKIGEHMLGGAMDDGNVAALGVIGNKKVTDVNVAGALAAGGFAIACHLDGALVILVEQGGLDGVALGFHKHLDVEGVGQVVAGTDNFSFGGAFTI